MLTVLLPLFQVTLNNVEACSENIMTLKKTLEVLVGSELLAGSSMS